MKVGTKSILFGAHCWFIHPWFVALAWWKLYGFPWDIRLWVAFFVHDLGYWGKPNMDGPEGEEHVLFGARVMHRLFDRETDYPAKSLLYGLPNKEAAERWDRLTEWGDFCLYHSRFYAKRDNKPFSSLCVADKLSVALEPWWLYLPRVYASGELWEYLALAGGKNNSKYEGEPNSKYVSMQLETGTVRGWHKAMTSYLRDWVAEHQDGRQDTWTPSRS